MEKVLEKIKRPSWIISLISFGAIYLIQMIFMIGIMAAGDGGNVVGSLLSMLLFTVLLVALILSVVFKKEIAGKIVIGAMLGYFLIAQITSLPNGTPYDGGGVATAMFIFDIASLLALFAVLVLILLRIFVPKIPTKVFVIIEIVALASFSFFYLIARCLELGVFGHYKSEYGIEEPWYFVMLTIGQFFYIPLAIFGYFTIFSPAKDEIKPSIGKEKESQEPKEEKKEE